MHKVLFVILLLTLTLAQLTNISRSGGFNIYLFDAVALVFSFYGIFLMLINKSFVIPKSLFFYLVFLIFGAFSLFANSANYSSVELLTSSFYIVRFFSYLFSAIFLYNLLEKDLISSDFLVSSFILSGLVLAIAGFVQLIVLPDFTALESSLGWDPHKGRLASTFFDPNFAGAYLVLCLSLLLDKAFSKNPYSRFWLVFSLSVLFSAILLTFSRSAWLMLGVVLVTFGLTKARFLLVLSIFVAFGAYFAVPRIQTRISGITDPADSAHFRLISWENALEIAQDNIVLGVGFNSYRYAQESYSFFDAGTSGGNSGAGADSSFLFVLATTGFIGFCIFCVAYFVPVFAFRNVLNIAVLSSLFLESLFINSFFYPQIVFLLFGILVFNEATRSVANN